MRASVIALVMILVGSSCLADSQTEQPVQMNNTSNIAQHSGSHANKGQESTVKPSTKTIKNNKNKIHKSKRNRSTKMQTCTHTITATKEGNIVETVHHCH
jgi:hypothetical protein